MKGVYRVERSSGGGIPSVAEMRRKLESEGYSAFEWTDPPGAAYEIHEHSQDQTHWIISGSIELDVEGLGRIILNPGDRDLMPAGMRHSARVVGMQGVRYIIGERS